MSATVSIVDELQAFVLISMIPSLTDVLEFPPYGRRRQVAEGLES
jgi:hypothetical protein